jgi:glutathione S-transferase
MTGKKITLIGSITSPYVRCVRVLCEELKVNYNFEITSPYGKITPDQAQLIRRKNPLNRVPILIIDDEELIESRIINTYLIQNYAQNATKDSQFHPTINIKEENFISMIYGSLDAGILSFMLTRADPQLDITKGYCPNIVVRIKNGLEWCNSQLEIEKSFLTETFGMPQIVLCATLEWFKKRNIYDWCNLNGIKSVYNQWKDRESLVKTRIPENI